MTKKKSNRREQEIPNQDGPRSRSQRQSIRAKAKQGHEECAYCGRMQPGCKLTDLPELGGLVLVCPQCRKLKGVKEC
jgi:hypothetical protein